MNRLSIMTVRVLFAVIAAMLTATPSSAQDFDVRGRVIGPDNSPLASQRVVLHRVDTSAGATVAEDTTAADGTFTLSTQQSQDTSALYFVASRYEGELYIGPPFRQAEGAMDQVLQVGIPAMSATQLMGEGALPPTGGGTVFAAPPTSRGWMLLLIPLLGVAAVGIYALVPRSSIPAHRALLIRVAELDERMTTAPAAQVTTLREERAHLLSQLRAAG